MIGFTGTPVDKTAYGNGTFKIFGADDEQGYLHKYSIAESIEDGTTLPLYYNLAPNEMRVPTELLEEEFLKLTDNEGITDIEELNADPRAGGQSPEFPQGPGAGRPGRRATSPITTGRTSSRSATRRSWSRSTAKPAPSTRRRWTRSCRLPTRRSSTPAPTTTRST